MARTVNELHRIEHDLDGDLVDRLAEDDLERLEKRLADEARIDEYERRMTCRDCGQYGDGCDCG